MSKVPIKDQYEIFFDGASKGNPGKAGGAAVINKNGIEIAQVSKYVGPKATNNEAEYNGLIMGLQLAIDLGLPDLINQGIAELTIKGDSQLIIRQMLGQYAVKNARMKQLWMSAQDLVKQIPIVHFMHIPRAQNTRADALASAATAVPIKPKQDKL